MISDENQLKAAYTMADAAEKMRLAADQIDQASQRFERLLGVGYGNNIDRLIEALEKARPVESMQYKAAPSP